MTTSTIRGILKELVKAHGSQRAVARLLGISESRLGKLLKKNQHLSVYHCLLLAKVSMKSGDAILRGDGKQREANLIGELWGPPTQQELPEELQIFLQRWQALPPKVRAMVQGLITEDD